MPSSVIRRMSCDSGSCSRFESQTLDALMQDRAQVAEVEKLLREQVGAVALDERDERFPLVLVGEPLDDAQPQRAAVGEPAIELRSVRSCSASTSIVSDGRVVWKRTAVRSSAVGVPIFGRGDERRTIAW